MGLGFEDKDIFAREDYLQEISLAYGHKDYSIITTKFDPNGFLIDNLPPSDFRTAGKMKFLGINAQQTATIREYTGGKDPKKFQEQEWPAIIEYIKSQQ